MKVGIDITKNDKIKKLMEDERAFKKVFTDYELTYTKGCPVRLAGRFAVKEAFFKAIGKKVDWLDVEIRNREGGEPYLLYKNIEQSDISLSISHEDDYSVAIVIKI
jgi:holo-[acyl-carrier protein] synthase